MDYGKKSVEMSKEHKGQLKIENNFLIQTKDDLSTAYTPGIAQVCKEIHNDPSKYKELTFSGNLVAVITDGSAVLGLGNIGSKAAIPVMEGKSSLMKAFGDVNAIPITLDTQDTNEIITTVKNIKSSFGAINLEDIAAPRCFEILSALQDIGVPVFHDDQHGTAIVVLAALQNALKKLNKTKDVKVVINGAGAAGMAIFNLLLDYGIQNTVMVDSKGIITTQRDDLNPYKKEIAQKTKANPGTLQDALQGADVFIGVSKGNILDAQKVSIMSENAIMFAMANPTPELPIEEAKKAENIKIYATGRSDYPNQINNALAFPGIFKGLIEARATKIHKEVFLQIATALAQSATDELLPSILDKEIHKKVAQTVINFYNTKDN